MYPLGMKVAVYVGKEDEAKLKAQGKDPAAWVRGLVKHGLKRLNDAPPGDAVLADRSAPAGTGDVT